MTIISRSNKFIFVHVHKCGGTSVEVAYEPHKHWCDIVLGSTELGELINLPFFNLHGIQKHSSAFEISQVIGSDSSFYDYIVLVRNPVERLKSLFKWVKRAIIDWSIERGISFQDAIYLLTSKKENPYFMSWEPFQLFIASTDVTSFSEYVNSLYDHIPYWFPKKDMALCPMIEFIVGVDINKSHIFKVEEMNKFWQWMSTRLSCDVTPVHVNESNNGVSEDITLDLSLTPNARIKLIKMFDSDFRYFDYDVQL